jgi:hypothetical protein
MPTLFLYDLYTPSNFPSLYNTHSLNDPSPPPFYNTHTPSFLNNSYTHPPFSYNTYTRPPLDESYTRPSHLNNSNIDISSLDILLFLVFLHLMHRLQIK